MTPQANNHGLRRLGSEQKRKHEERGDFNEEMEFSALIETQGSNYGEKSLYFPTKIFSMCLDGSGSMFDF